MQYQLCPKCNGQGTVTKPPWVQGDVYKWASSSTSFVCDVCNGDKVLLILSERNNENLSK
jgi:DnaJ-class molecular chaperone